ncbi:hypothetical protein [Corynebacterium glutamicum]|uniref:hypothetical protein n=1 Tax=Corynebacterium glutamicum TaxID=1718 RepID=UPI0014653C85|nr:hypothetical protein [Corynebacterium glutamicum]GFK19190.1 hypothetical protein KbCgl_17620 [Corynebacterium glutamicum]
MSYEPFAAHFYTSGASAFPMHSLTIEKGLRASGTTTRLKVPDAAITIFGTYDSFYAVEIWGSGATDGSPERMLGSFPAGSGLISGIEFAPRPGEGIQARTRVNLGQPVSVILKVIPMPYSS